MSENIEIEAKVLLLKDEYENIIKTLKLGRYHIIKQTNYYIDTQDYYLAQNRIACRVREINQEFELTLKTPLSEGLLEKNETLSWRDFDALKDDNKFPEGNIRKFLAILGADLNNLSILTSLTTSRIELEYNNCIVSIDKNEYSDMVDYELEVEATSMRQAREVALELLNECGIKDSTFNTVSKKDRALNAIRK